MSEHSPSTISHAKGVVYAYSMVSACEKDRPKVAFCGFQFIVPTGEVAAEVWCTDTNPHGRLVRIYNIF